jgi:hypothetical protein
MNRLLAMFIAGILSTITAFVLDALFLPGVSAQWATQGYPTTKAKVLECGPAGTAWSLRSISYEYKVQRKTYQGTLLRHGGCPPPFTPDPSTIFNSLKPGQTLDIRYRPDRPETCIALSGLQASDHCILLLITALHCGGFGLLFRAISTRTLNNRYPETGGMAYYVRGVSTVLDSQPSFPLSSACLAMGTMLTLCSVAALKSSYFYLDSPVVLALAVTAAAFAGGLELRKSETHELTVDPGSGKLTLPIFHTSRPTVLEIFLNWTIGPERLSIHLPEIKGISHLPLLGQQFKNWAFWSVGIVVKHEDETMKSIIGLGQSREESEQLAKWLKTKLKFSGQTIKSERS